MTSQISAHLCFLGTGIKDVSQPQLAKGDSFFFFFFLANYFSIGIEIVIGEVFRSQEVAGTYWPDLDID